MSYWNAKFPNDHDEYEITFASKYKEKTKIVEKVCRAIIDKKVNSIEDISIGGDKPVKWIPVTERLPDVSSEHKRNTSHFTKSVRVLCACVQKSGKRMAKEGYCEVWNGRTVNWKIPGDIHTVTHWRPLPELPDDGGAEND